jgi:hypothetical protein
MKHVKDGLKAAAMAWVLLGSCAPAPLLAGDPPPASPAKPHRIFWDLGQYTWLRLTPREPGAALNDPQTPVEAAALTQRLGTIRATTSEGVEALFAPMELAGLAKAMGEALSLAGPGEDLLLFSSSRRSQGFLSSPLAVSARIFLRDGALNIIVQDARLEVLGRYAPDGDWSKIDYGTRGHASQVTLSCPEAISRRGDWLVFALDKVPAVPAVPPVPKPVDASIHPVQEKRLRDLLHLREEKLISEKEYQAKRAEIIKSL